MSTPDSFARFVACMASRLDDHELRTDALAREVFLSRSQLDRLVARIGGETPTRFRRRVLLERAAFRLISSGDSVLEIAVEAGFGSQEAFTRAFVRAYGLPPRQWRSAPTQVLLDAPNGVHFHPPAGLRLPSPQEVTPMNVLIQMVDHHVWLLHQILERAATLDQAILDQPIETAARTVDDQPTLRSLLSRLVGQMDMWNQALVLQDYDWSIEQYESVPAMRARLRRVGPVFVEHVRHAVDQGRLGDTFVHAQVEPARVYTYGGLIAHVLTFAAYRRTLVLGALTSAGAGDLELGDPREWVADAPH